MNHIRLYHPTSYGPSPHLGWEELACHDANHTPYPEEWREDRAPTLAAVFEAIRTICGAMPITILSAYRTEAYNQSVGGAPLSQHVQGRALDLQPPLGLQVEEFRKLIMVLATTIEEIGGVGTYPAFIHVDTRPRTNGQLATWDYRHA